MREFALKSERQQEAEKVPTIINALIQRSFTVLKVYTQSTHYPNIDITLLLNYQEHAAVSEKGWSVLPDALPEFY